MKNNMNLKRRDFLKGGSAIGLASVASVSLFPLGSTASLRSDNTLADLYHCILGELRKGRKIRHRILTTGDGHWFDVHITTANERLGKWANDIDHEERYRRMIAWLNQEIAGEGADFVVFNGDLVTNRPEHLPIAKSACDRLNGTYYVTHGNHDHSSEENWQKLWGYGRNHSFTFGDYAVILLNSADEKGTYQCADHHWLKGQLDTYADKAGILVFCHIWQHGGGEAFANGVDCPEVTNALLKADNTKLVMYSHTHRIHGHYPIFDTIPSGRRRLDTFFTGHFAAWGLPYLGYRVIEIYDDGEIGTYAVNQAERQIVNWTKIEKTVDKAVV